MIRGFGLHGGQPATVRFVPEAGPVRVRVDTQQAIISELKADGSTRSTVISNGTLRIGTVEHLFAALEARSIRDGIIIEVEGAEIPLVDGSARAFADALVGFELPAAPRPVITRNARFEAGKSVYDFAPANGVNVEVAIDFADERIARSAGWNGDAEDFRTRIAPARTFGFAHELGALMARGLANHVTPESVIVFAADAIHVAGAPYSADEPARHKLLDLLGDLYVHGGAPVGKLHAERPGHAATHEIMRRAWDEGVVRWS